MLKTEPVHFSITNESQVRRTQSDGESDLRLRPINFPFINESQVRRARSDGESLLRNGLVYFQVLFFLVRRHSQIARRGSTTLII